MDDHLVQRLFQEGGRNFYQQQPSTSSSSSILQSLPLHVVCFYSTSISDLFIFIIIISLVLNNSNLIYWWKGLFFGGIVLYQSLDKFLGVVEGMINCLFLVLEFTVVDGPLFIYDSWSSGFDPNWPSKKLLIVFFPSFSFCNLFLYFFFFGWKDESWKFLF